MRNIVVLAVFLFSSLGLVTQAQKRAPRWKIAFTKVSLLKTRYQEEGIRLNELAPDRRSDWVHILLEYELSAGTGKSRTARWADEVEFSWVVILPIQSTSRKLSAKRAIRLKKKIIYGNVQEGKHYASIYLDPKIYTRYKDKLSKDLLFAALRVKISGKTRGQLFIRGKKNTSSSREMRKLFPEFGRSTWFESEEVRTVKGSLLSRMQTPWEWQSWDSFEHIIHQE